ncbi:MAG: HlyD family efflux transporter periplasmic adaptor subunit [Chloroflexi bacterium]|nr:HlyD family efflux transporter periplasmic adaptor subunit [Chloroflexota bacterium]
MSDAGRDVDIDALIRGRCSRRRWLLPGVAALVVAAAAAAFLLLRPEEAAPVPEPQRATAVEGRLNTTLQLSGSAVSERSADLSFEAAGVVASVAVESGDAVRAGDPLAALDDEDARRRVESAEIQLRLAQLRLDALLADPEASAIASARQSIESAESQVAGAEQALARLSEPPSASELASAEQSVASALGQLSSAEEALAALLAGPSETEIASARSAVTEARAQRSGAVDRADESWRALGAAFEAHCEQYAHLNDVSEVTCVAALPLSDAQVQQVRDSLEGRSSNFQRSASAVIAANVAYVGAEASREASVTALASAEERLGALLAPVSAEDRYQAEQSVAAARASHASAVARLEDVRAEPTADELSRARLSVDAARASHAAAEARLSELRAPADAADIEHARASLESARASLASARARYDELLAGPTANAIAQQEESVRLAEISLEEARDALAALTLRAPFDGVVEAVSVRPGDRVTANLPAFSLGTPDRMLIELTVTEADLLDLGLGQAGLATFDAVEGAEYPVRISSVSRVPNAAQGVVTYDVAARILVGVEIAEVASELAALGGAAAAGDAGAAGGAARGLLAGLELPEGVTVQQVLQALASGEPLPGGVVLPEGLEIPPQLLERLAAGLAGQGAGVGRREAEQGAPAARPLPAPGMSASVTILTELREPSVLVPVAAVRQLDGAWFVTVPAGDAGDDEGAAHAFVRLTVEVGKSDGTSVEVTSGLEPGAVLLIGADGAGVAFSATQQQPDLPVFPRGGGFGGGGAGGAGGGGAGR